MADYDHMFFEEPTFDQLADACLWYRHDFGILDDDIKRLVMYSMREHWRAVWKAVNTPGRGNEFNHDLDKPKPTVG